ncbi:MAG: tetratricopeptide repeat protein [Gammaproteobacteria bacterium]
MYIKNVVFTFIIVTGFFAASELILASIGVSPVLLTEDPFVGFAENVPQFVEFTAPDGTVILRTANNKRGLFNYQEFPREKDSNSYRIFCMGGSTTYGRPYYDKVSFCGWLREYLNAAEPARNWEVINAGGISFASYRVAKLMSELKQYQPDLFIVYSGQNEFLEERSYGALADLPSWLVNLNAALSGTRVYTAMKDVIDAVQPDSLQQAKQRYKLGGEVEEVLNFTIGPESYHRDDALKQQIITHYRLNLMRMVRIARSADADIVFVQPAINIKDMSPFKSEHREGLDKQTQQDWENLVQRATALFEAGELTGALTDYQQALDLDDRYADLHYRIGQVLFSLGRHHEAEQSFRQAVEEDVAPLRILGAMQQTVEEVAASENVPLIDFPGILRKAYLQQYDHAIFGKEYFPDHVHANMEGYRLLGLALLDHLRNRNIVMPDANWSAARIEAVRDAVIAQLDPAAEGHTFMNLGKVLDWAGKFEEAYDLFQQALEILGPNPVIYDRLARSSFALGKDDEALHYLHEIRRIAPELPGVQARLAMIYDKQGKTDKAIAHCRAELEIKPDDHYVHAALANLYVKKGDDAAAYTQFNTALEFKPDYQYARVEFSYLLIKLHRYDEALLHARETLRLNPEHYRAHNALGIIMKMKGDPDAAALHFTEALRLEPGYTPAEENLRQLQTLHVGKSANDDLS